MRQRGEGDVAQPCPKCKAKAGADCINTSNGGQFASLVHRERQPVEHCCTHPGTGICMCDCHDNRNCVCGSRNTKMRRFSDGV